MKIAFLALASASAVVALQQAAAPAVAVGAPVVTAAPVMRFKRHDDPANPDHAHPHEADEHAQTATTCEPHGDHWHCPEGVAEPTTAPAAATSAVAHEEDHDDDDHSHATACEPHGDHWHCPSGVAEPTTPPAASASATGAAVPGAAINGGALAALMGAAGMLFV